jgi:nicotinate phosphoribosyltransferase
MLINLAQRAHNHNFERDWIIRSLLDTDFYKLLMLQFIWKNYQDIPVTFSLINRTKSVKLAEEIDFSELLFQLNHLRTLSFTNSELIWLAGNTFYGVRNIFEPKFIEWLRHFKLPDFSIMRHPTNGQIELIFEGDWVETTMWEIYALAVVAEMRTRAGLAAMNEFELDVFYSRAKAKLWSKIETLRKLPNLSLTDFGTRRRHSFLWQEYVVQAMKSELPGKFTGTSNAYLAFKHDLEAKGTNAHELPMVVAALARIQGNEEALKQSQYKVLEQWQRTYGGALLIMLPDTFGTTQFLRDAPDWVADWTGLRVDSKDPRTAGYEYLDWLRERGRDPSKKLLLFSDGLDVDDIVNLHAEFGNISRDAYGWGTLLTNDFRGCHPRNLNVFDPISLVCKVAKVNGQPAVKLSDNYTKATGPAEEVAHYRSVFGTAGVANAPVRV